MSVFEAGHRTGSKLGAAQRVYKGVQDGTRGYKVAKGGDTQWDKGVGM